jgi:hypothetical protein
MSNDELKKLLDTMEEVAKRSMRYSKPVDGARPTNGKAGKRDR